MARRHDDRRERSSIAMDLHSRKGYQRLPSAALGNRRSAALVVLGRPGAGKTTLLEYAMGRSMDLRLARVVGIESEKPLRFAGLHQLLAPFLPRLRCTGVSDI